ncbi:MAG: VanW family protein [Sporichthyaceae bacterium]
MARRVLAVGVGALLSILFGLYVAAYAASGSDLPRGARVLGVDIGGLSQADAQARLTALLPARVDRTVRVTAAPRTFELTASAAGLVFDVPGTVAQIGSGRSLDPGRLLPAFFGARRDFDPVFAIDETALTKAVKRIAGKVNRPLREGSVAFVDGVAVATKAQERRKVLRGEAAAALREAFTEDQDAVEFTVETTAPVIGNDEVERVRSQFAVPAMAAPITVDLDGVPVSLQPREYDDFLSITAVGAALVGDLDGQALADYLTEQHPELVTTPVDASYIFVRNKPQLMPGANGERIEQVTLRERMLAAFTATAPRSVLADVVDVEPELTTAQAAALGILEPISTFRTDYPIVDYRVTNIGRAAELIDASLVVPGATWSLNDTVGERTEENGFVKGFVIKDGAFAEDLGGGVSQSATTVFNAMFFAGLEDVEHHPHSLYISRYPAGREATVAFGLKDLRFRNNSPTGVLIRAIHKPGLIRITFWGTRHFERIASVTSPRYNLKEPSSVVSRAKGCVPQTPSSGFDVDVRREYYVQGKVVKSETFRTTYKPTDRITCLPPRTGKKRD